jgi:hypothetical protein
MSKEELIPWIERLNAEPDKGKRKDIVADLCKEKGLKPDDAWKLLNAAGYDPKAKPAGSQTNAGQEAKRSILASHKTEYERYRCAGLVLTRKPETYLVTDGQLEKLARDPWVTVENK